MNKLFDDDPPKRFRPPTAEQVREYAAEIGCDDLVDDPEAFIDYFGSIGWVVGRCRKPMRNWRLAVHNWKRNHQTGEKMDGVNKLRAALRKDAK